MFKVTIKAPERRQSIYSKLTIKTPGVFCLRFSLKLKEIS